MKILIVDDHGVVREGLATVLRSALPNVQVLQAADRESALAAAASHPDIALVLMDLALPDSTGLTAVEDFLAAHPATPLVVVSSSEAPADVRAALELGALGYVAKSANTSTLSAAVRLVLSGEVYVPPFMARAEQTAPPLRPAALQALTERQHAVLDMVRAGASNKQIAYRLGVTEGTVKAHLTAIFRTLGVATRDEAARLIES